jgi:hypothetical protein
VFATGRKWIAGFNMMGRQPTLRTQLFHCNSSLLCALLGVAFDHRDLWTSSRHSSFCWDFSKKDFIRITHDAWTKWKN